ncbi:MAG: hypothetical protein WBM70_04815 [Sulfurovum sp.]|jgi:hypothetical protein|uniref:hypothetical protein n=1 Tax=Sulfurovum sp. TaxID=1969726 RepID=UPI003C72459D
MKKFFILILVLMIELNAADRRLVTGTWKSVDQSNNHGTKVIEKEYLYLNGNGTFTIVLLVSVQKGDAFVRDLEIKGSGIWKVSNHTLVAVVKKMEVPFAKEVYRISQESLRHLATTFKNRFEKEPIRILTIKSIDQNNLITVNEASKQTNYIRQ